LETERKKAAIDAELQALMVKKAELDAPVELKTEKVEEVPLSCPILWRHPASAWKDSIWW
jgi:hypothetical protein